MHPHCNQPPHFGNKKPLRSTTTSAGQISEQRLLVNFPWNDKLLCHNVAAGYIDLYIPTPTGLHLSVRIYPGWLRDPGLSDASPSGKDDPQKFILHPTTTPVSFSGLARIRIPPVFRTPPNPQSFVFSVCGCARRFFHSERCFRIQSSSARSNPMSSPSFSLSIHLCRSTSSRSAKNSR